MNFCVNCGKPVHREIPAGDNRERHVCAACGHIHYVNPRIVAGCIPEFGGQVLLCRRAIAPRLGFWTMPAGFMETGETMAEAAAREALEEACARVEVRDLIAVVDVVQAAQVHVFFRGTMVTPDFAPGAESLETRLVSPGDIPWDDLAFPSVRIALRRYIEIRDIATAAVHLVRAPHGPRT